MFTCDNTQPFESIPVNKRVAENIRNFMYCRTSCLIENKYWQQNSIAGQSDHLKTNTCLIEKSNAKKSPPKFAYFIYGELIIAAREDGLLCLQGSFHPILTTRWNHTQMSNYLQSASEFSARQASFQLKPAASSEWLYRGLSENGGFTTHENDD